MANKVFKKNFARDFKGISGECASVEESDGTVNRAINYEYSVGNSLRGRVGCQNFGANGFFGIFPYTYTRTKDDYKIVYQAPSGVHPNEVSTLTTTKTLADGATVSKLVGINKQCWVQETLDVTITQTNAGTYTWYSYVNGSHMHFVIKKDGVSILDTDTGDGIGGLSGVDSIYTLLGVIDALADLSVAYTRGVCPPYAIASGAATVVGGGYGLFGDTNVLQVNAGHTFYPGDIVSGYYNDGTATSLVGGLVLATTANTITYAGPYMSPTGAGQVFGYMAQCPATFPVDVVSSETSGALIISFPYWRLIPEGDQSKGSSTAYGQVWDAARAMWGNKSLNSFYAPPVAVNLLGDLFVASSGATTRGILGYANNLIALDAYQVKRAGAGATGASAGPVITLGAVAAGALTGTYKWKCQLRQFDAQGNIIEGPVTAVSSATLAAQNQAMGIAVASYADRTGWAVRSCYKNTAESAATALTVSMTSAAAAGTAFVQPGDVIHLLDNTTQTAGLTFISTGAAVGNVHRTRVTQYDGVNNSIRVEDNTAYTVPGTGGANPMSYGGEIRLLRTAAGGNQFYVVADIPIDFYTAGGLAITDNVTDAVLITKEQYIEVQIGKEHNPPPACSLVCVHQGGLVVARGVKNQVFPPGTFVSTESNGVAFSSVDGPQYFPTASNSFEVPSTQSGAITAIASDTVDRLAVFKEKAYYDIQGDLDGGTFSVNVANEGDFGITSQASLVRVNNALIGVCKNGWMVIQDGFLDPYKFKDVSSRLINQKYQFAWAVAVNDSFNRQYICAIPQITGEPVIYALDYSRNKIIALERSYATKLDQAGGMAMVGDTLYHLSITSPYCVHRRLYRFNGDSPTGDNGDSFIDNTGAINYVLESQPESLGEPAQLKTPQKARIWSLPNDYVVEGWVPFTFRFETGASPIAAFIGSGGINNTNVVDSFLTANDVFKDVELVKQKVNFYITRITVNTIRQAPFITAYEIEYADNYKKEDLQK